MKQIKFWCTCTNLLQPTLNLFPHNFQKMGIFYLKILTKYSSAGVDSYFIRNFCEKIFRTWGEEFQKIHKTHFCFWIALTKMGIFLRKFSTQTFQMVQITTVSEVRKKKYCTRTYYILTHHLKNAVSVCMWASPPLFFSYQIRMQT